MFLTFFTTPPVILILHLMPLYPDFKYVLQKLCSGAFCLHLDRQYVLSGNSGSVNYTQEVSCKYNKLNFQF